MEDLFWMKRALLLANKAYNSKKVPVGAVLVMDNFEIGSSFNYSGLNHCSFYHAEVISIKQGSFYISNYLFLNVKLYVTLKPCKMCISYCFLSKIKKIIFCLNSKENKNIENICFINNNIFENESISLLKNFFKKSKKLIV